MKISIFTNPVKTKDEIKKYVEDIAISIGFIIDNENPDVVFACGGDGTMLRSIHHFKDKLDSIRFCGANFGSLGFFYDFSKDNVKKALEDIYSLKMLESEHLLIHGTAYYKNKILKDFDAVNEIRIEKNSKPIMCEVFINDYNFESYIGTGLTASSTIGSSAYNMTLNGSVVSHDLETIQLTPIQPSTQCKCLKSSVVLGTKNEITITGDLKEVLLGYDHVVSEHNTFDKLVIRSSNLKFKWLKSNNQNNVSKFSKLFS